eukprot:s2126_g4.t1
MAQPGRASLAPALHVAAVPPDASMMTCCCRTHATVGAAECSSPKSKGPPSSLRVQVSQVSHSQLRNRSLVSRATVRGIHCWSRAPVPANTSLKASCGVST